MRILLNKLEELEKNHVVQVKLIEKKTASKRIAKILGIGENEKVLYIERLRFMDEIPLLLEQSYMLYPMFYDLNIWVVRGI